MINFKDIEDVPIEQIKLNPVNTNKHPEDQIEDLAKIINYQGMRWPLLVARRIGNITANVLAAGEGRFLACKMLGLKTVPVMYQDFEDDDQFRAFVTSDNAIAAWAQLDFQLVNDQIAEFDPSFDIDLLGIKNFELVPEDKYANDENKDKPKKEKKSRNVTCPSCLNEFTV